ncbi:unnamed protein product [Aspergillus oryzae]|uniref:Unnamed protein product n=1 Tax=Aspergillus oryzae var. brunneus TaxID=332754 RepID=A0ABQ6KRZ6_ASPOZ|nr:unnamed protein product [Aspergillus oryzae]GMF91953.1 unnamed protein product [Aspergillus oryzae]GMG11245.1 unnamed protein product [Aspergillus oryzae]GMG48166.1 unnamed protein product [Aspergillus oryzae var. brunneus]
MAGVPISGELAGKYGYLALSIYSGVSLLVGSVLLAAARFVQTKKSEAKRLSKTMPDMCKDELLYSQKLPAQNTGVQPLESAKLISALDPMRILTWSRCPSSAASDSEVRPSLSIQSRRPALSIRSLNESVGRHSTAKKMLVRPSELQKFKLIPLCCKSVLSTLHSGVAFAKGDMPSIWKLMSSNEFLR